MKRGNMPYKDPEKQREANKKWYEENKEKRREQQKKWRKENPEYNKKWREKNKEKVREYDREKNKNWRKENLEKAREASKKWKEENREKVREYDNKKYHTDPCYKLRSLTSGMVRKALKSGKGGESMLPYVDWNSYEELEEHLESQFEDWMTWDNHGEWHIDHIKPQSVLLEGVTSMDDPKFRECWTLENLRPLEARENMIKGNKIIDE